MNTATTTDDTLTADLKASLLKSDLEARDICEHSRAERMARLCVSLTEADTYDAALWKAAEASYRFMDGRADQTPLATQSAHVRQLHLTIAIQVMASMRLALEGGFGRERMAQAFADISNHKEMLGVAVDASRRRSHLKAVSDGR